jgi:hypothetical protein
VVANLSTIGSSQSKKRETNETFTNIFNMFIFGKQCGSRPQLFPFTKDILSMFGEKMDNTTRATNGAGSETVNEVLVMINNNTK